MHPRLSRPLLTILATLVMPFFAGCSAEARKQRYLKSADEYLAAGEYAKAELEYLNVLRIEGMNPDAIVNLGKIYFEQARLGRVYPYLAKARELRPDDLDVRARLAMFQAGVGKLTEARDDAAFVLSQRPDDAEAPLVLADTITSEADLRAVQATLSQLPDAARQGAPVLTALGVLELRQRRVTEAHSFFERALAATPNFTPALLAQASAYWATGNLEQAAERFKAAADTAPHRSVRRLQYAKFRLQTGDIDSAKEFLTGVTTSTPDFVAPWVMLGEINAGQGNLAESLAALEKALSLDQHHPEAVLLSGRVRLMNGERERAVTELERAIRIYPLSPQLHHQLAIGYLANGDISKATAEATQAVALAPQYVDAITLLADLNLRQRNFAPALAALRQLAQKNPKLLAPQLLLAQGLRAQGSLDSAVDVYEGLERVHPNDPQIPVLRGAVLLQQQKESAARAAFERALAISPDYFQAAEHLVDLDLAAKRPADARARLEELLRRHPNVAILHVVLAKVHLVEGNEALAEAALLTAGKLQPNLPVTYFLLARIYMGSEQPEKAIANLQLAAEKNPKDVQALMLIGILQEQRKDFASARATYERLLTVDSKFAAALNNLAYLCAEQFGETEKALELAQRARELQPGEPHVADTMGWVLYRKGQYAWAAILLAESADAMPDAADVQFHHGMAQYMLGNEVAATAALEKALKIDSNFAAAEHVRTALSILAINAATAGAPERALLEKAAASGKDSLALTKLGRMHRRLGDLDAARQAYDATLKLNPNNIAAGLELVSLLQELKQGTEALALARNIRKLAPTDPAIALALGQLALANGDRVWAASLLQEAARAAPQDGAAAYAHGMAAYGIGRVETALSELRRALELSTDDNQSVHIRSIVSRMTFNPATATTADIAEIEAALRADPRDGATLMASAAIAEHRGDTQRALRTYETTLTSYPEFSPAMKRLAILAATEPELRAGALDFANKARQAFPDDVDVGKALGLLLYRSDNYSRAVSVLRETAQRRPDDPQLLFYLGRAEARVKNTDASRQFLQRALDLGLSPEDATEARRLLTATNNA